MTDPVLEIEILQEKFGSGAIAGVPNLLGLRIPDGKAAAQLQ
jgi:hypothetical protein